MVKKGLLTAAFVCALLSLMNVACGHMAGTRKQDSWGGTDPEALRVQALARTAVKIKNRYALSSDDPEVQALIDSVPAVGASGSGNVVARRGESTLVMTAGHVCRVKDDTLDTMVGPVAVTGYDLSIITADGKEMRARQVLLDEDHDLCFLDVVGVAGEVAEIGRSMPDRESRVEFAGAPIGFWGTGVVLEYAGRFAGLMSDPKLTDGNTMAVFAMVCAPGASGSGIFYDGKIVSIVDAVMVNFDNITLGVTVDHIVDDFLEAQNKWRAK